MRPPDDLMGHGGHSGRVIFWVGPRSRVLSHSLPFSETQDKHSEYAFLSNYKWRLSKLRNCELRPCCRREVRGRGRRQCPHSSARCCLQIPRLSCVRS